MIVKIKDISKYTTLSSICDGPLAAISARAATGAPFQTLRTGTGALINKGGFRAEDRHKIIR